MAKRKSGLPTKASDEVTQEKASKTPKVAFEVSDEDLENASGGAIKTTTATPGLTTFQCISLGCPGNIS